MDFHDLNYDEFPNESHITERWCGIFAAYAVLAGLDSTKTDIRIYAKVVECVGAKSRKRYSRSLKRAVLLG